LTVKKGRPKKRWKEVIDVEMKVRGLHKKIRCHRSYTLETWLQKPAYPLHARTTNWAPREQNKEGF